MSEPRKRAKRKKVPKHKGDIRAWRFAVRHGQDTSALHRALDIAWQLRNDLAAERAENGRAIRAAKAEGRKPPARVTLRAQEMTLAERRKREPDGAGKLHSLAVKNISDRIHEGWQRFWDAIAEGRPGVRPPRPVKRERYRSLTYPQYGNGVRIRDGRVELSMIGSFRLHDHRKVRGRILTVTMKWTSGRWWCIVTTQLPADLVRRPVAEGSADVGADPGLSAVLTLSDGRVLDPPRALAGKLGELRHEQRKLSRKFEKLKARQAEEHRAARAEGRDAQRLALPNRLRRQIARVGKVHTKVADIRSHWHKLNARRIADRYDRVAIEDHGLAFMIRNRKLARSASDRALGMQKEAMASALGPRLVLVANRRPGIGGNSQTCLCGASVPKTLRERQHDCPACGLSAPRDLVSANIVEMVAFGTRKITTAPGRGPKDAQDATACARESAPAAGPRPDRAPVTGIAVMASTSSDLIGESTACGQGPGRKARPVVIGQEPLARAPKPPRKTLRKHPASAG